MSEDLTDKRLPERLDVDRLGPLAIVAGGEIENRFLKVDELFLMGLC